MPSPYVVSQHPSCWPGGVVFSVAPACVRAREVFGVSDLIVVTQSYHVPRAVATCVRVGVNASGVGDDSARQYARSWRSGAIRDQLACVKTVLDLVFDRRPALGQG